jgi:hypothetical protein
MMQHPPQPHLSLQMSAVDTLALFDNTRILATNQVGLQLRRLELFITAAWWAPTHNTVISELFARAHQSVNVGDAPQVLAVVDAIVDALMPSLQTRDVVSSYVLQDHHRLIATSLRLMSMAHVHFGWCEQHYLSNQTNSTLLPTLVQT